MDVRTERVLAFVSAAASASDGTAYDVVLAQPPRLQDSPAGAGVSNPGGMLMVEMIRRMFTHITSPSATLISGGSAGAVAVAYCTAGPSGITGMFQGVPFALSGAANGISGQPTSLISTASNEIRKVLVTLALSALPAGSSMALGAGTMQFVYGSAVRTSAGAVTSGSQTTSYFDTVPMPLPSAGEIPLGLLYVVNSFATSAGLINSCMITDWRMTQGVNLSAMYQNIQQP